jgi:hypothetical protein
MSKYPVLEAALADRSFEWELEEEEMIENLLYELRDDSYRTSFETELRAAFHDPDWNWLDKLREFKVYLGEEECDARNVAIELFWEPTFPDVQPPMKSKGSE